MLARPEWLSCIECGRSHEASGFSHHHGRSDDGPAYCCDRGVLCSVECSLAHHHKRLAEGSAAEEPAPAPAGSARLFGEF